MCLVSFSKTPKYSALDKLNQQGPKWAYIVICDDCSHSCPWCYGGFNEQLSNRMSIDTFGMILNKCKTIGISQITIAGGEPTEHPDFMKFVELASSAGFLIHIASHGEHITQSVAQQLKSFNVKQVQVNFQGSENHTRIHGDKSSYQRQVAAIHSLNAVGIETTITLTVGAYNLKHIHKIFKEAADLNVTRLRVWETTGKGNRFSKDVEASRIFNEASIAAGELGYHHCLSYDPVHTGDVSVPCLLLSGLFMYVNSRAQLEYCGALPTPHIIADFVTDGPKTILDKYNTVNSLTNASRQPFCAAREPNTLKGVPINVLHI